MDIQVRALERAAAMGYTVSPAGSENFPEVSSGKIYDFDGKPIPSYQRLYREDSGDTLAIHTDNYELRRYHDSFAALEKAIEQSGLDTRGLMTKTDFSHNGGRCFRSYLFPHIGVSLRNDDVISLQILALDSYDGSYASSVAAGGYRYICLNGCLFGRTIQQLKVKHVVGGELRYQNAVEKVVQAAEVFTQMQPRIERWSSRPIDVHDFKRLVTAMPQATDGLVDSMVAKYATEVTDQTLYGGWNLLTDWASHSKGTRQSQLDRDRRVAMLVESGAWKTIEG